MKAKNNNLHLISNNDNAQHATRRKRAKRRLSRASKYILLISFVIFLVLLGSGWIKGYFVRFFVNTVPAEISILEDTKEVTFLVIRQEKAITSPVAGLFEKVCEEGERVAKDATIGYLIATTGTSLEKTEKIPVKTPYAGMISYKTDGYENLFTPEIWRELDINKVIELEKGLAPADGGKAKNDDRIESGQRLFKIVDNLAPEYLFTEFVLDSAKALEKGSLVDLNLEGSENPGLKGVVKDVESTDSKIRVLVEIHTTTQTRETRRLKGNIVVDRFTGVVVHQDVLVYKEDRPGVYILEKGLVQWREVNIAGAVKEKAAIAGLSTSDWIVTTPVLVKEGQRMFNN